MMKGKAKVYQFDNGARLKLPLCNFQNAVRDPFDLTEEPIRFPF